MSLNAPSLTTWLKTTTPVVWKLSELLSWAVQQSTRPQDYCLLFYQMTTQPKGRLTAHRPWTKSTWIRSSSLTPLSYVPLLPLPKLKARLSSSTVVWPRASFPRRLTLKLNWSNRWWTRCKRRRQWGLWLMTYTARRGNTWGIRTKIISSTTAPLSSSSRNTTTSRLTPPVWRA